MMTITLTLSESLLCIFRDSAAPRPETIEIEIDRGTTVEQILEAQHIHPLLVPMAYFGTDGKKEKVDMNTPIKTSGVLTLYGPLAGG